MRLAHLEPAAKTYRRGALSVLALMCCAWILFLFFQDGHRWDESEHAHAAWLVSRGERPLDDFFQHHQPLLWSILGLYFRIGLTGPGVLIWGRVLVALSGLMVFFSLWVLGREQDESRHVCMSWLGIVWFIGFTILLPELFVIRPETIATAAVLAALALWCKGPPSWAVAAGVLAGAACYASPRFLLVGGCFILLGLQSWRRWLLLLAGAVTFISFYTVVSGYPFAKVLFNLRFSAYLQTVGDEPHGISEAFRLNVAELAFLPLAALLGLAMNHGRLKAIVLLGYSAIVLFACQAAAGLFTYAQAYSPAIAAVSVTAAWIGGHSRAHNRLAGIGIGSTVVGMALLWSMMNPQPWKFTFLSDVRAREQLSASIPAGGKAMVFTIDSPITVEDASYYGSPIWDGRDRLCRAVNGFKSSYKLPRCDFLDVLQNAKPYVIDRDITRSMPAEDYSRAAAIIHGEYATPTALRLSATYFGGLMTRKAADP